MYAAALAAATVKAAPTAALDETASLPVVLAVMHLSYGCGFLFGSWRYGPPVAALAHLARVTRS